MACPPCPQCIMSLGHPYHFEEDEPLRVRSLVTIHHSHEQLNCPQRTFRCNCRMQVIPAALICDCPSEEPKAMDERCRRVKPSKKCSKSEARAPEQRASYCSSRPQRSNEYPWSSPEYDPRCQHSQPKEYYPECHQQSTAQQQQYRVFINKSCAQPTALCCHHLMTCQHPDLPHPSVVCPELPYGESMELPSNICPEKYSHYKVDFDEPPELLDPICYPQPTSCEQKLHPQALKILAPKSGYGSTFRNRKWVAVDTSPTGLPKARPDTQRKSVHQNDQPSGPPSRCSTPAPEEFAASAPFSEPPLRIPAEPGTAKPNQEVYFQIRPTEAPAFVPMPPQQNFEYSDRPCQNTELDTALLYSHECPPIPNDYAETITPGFCRESITHPAISRHGNSQYSQPAPKSTAAHQSASRRGSVCLSEIASQGPRICPQESAALASEQRHSFQASKVHTPIQSRRPTLEDPQGYLQISRQDQPAQSYRNNAEPSVMGRQNGAANTRDSFQHQLQRASQTRRNSATNTVVSYQNGAVQAHRNSAERTKMAFSIGAANVQMIRQDNQVNGTHSYRHSATNTPGNCEDLAAVEYLIAQQDIPKIVAESGQNTRVSFEEKLLQDAPTPNQEVPANVLQSRRNTPCYPEIPVLNLQPPSSQSTQDVHPVSAPQSRRNSGWNTTQPDRSPGTYLEVPGQRFPTIAATQPRRPNTGCLTMFIEDPERCLEASSQHIPTSAAPANATTQPRRPTTGCLTMLIEDPETCLEASSQHIPTSAAPPCRPTVACATMTLQDAASCLEVPSQRIITNAAQSFRPTTACVTMPLEDPETYLEVPTQRVSTSAAQNQRHSATNTTLPCEDPVVQSQIPFQSFPADATQGQQSSEGRESFVVFSPGIQRIIICEPLSSAQPMTPSLPAEISERLQAGFAPRSSQNPC